MLGGQYYLTETTVRW